VSIDPAPSDDDNGPDGAPGRMARARSDWRIVSVFSALVGFGVAAALFLFAGSEGPRPPSGDELQCKDLLRGNIAWNNPPRSAASLLRSGLSRSHRLGRRHTVALAPGGRAVRRHR
jgi:hypothetical protein